MKKIIITLVGILLLGTTLANEEIKNILIDEKDIQEISKIFNKNDLNNKIKQKGINFKVNNISFKIDNLIFNIKNDGINNSYEKFINYIKEHKNDIFKKIIINSWNNYIVTKYKDIVVYKNYNKCIDVYNLFNNIDNIKFIYSNFVEEKGFKFINELSDDTFGKIIACAYSYIFPNGVKLEKLKTSYIPYRYKNITMVINKNFIKILKPGEIFSTVNEVLRNKKYKFVNGKAIVGGKVKEIEAGGVCGISTILYQSIIKHLQHFKILERKPHSAWFSYLYGNIIGLDSTIYDMGKSVIDFKFQNIGPTAVILQGYNKKLNRYWFEYGIKIITPYLKNSYVKMGKLVKKETNEIHKYKDKKTGEEKEKKIVLKCVNNYIYDSKTKLLGKIKSCYKFVNEEF